MKLSPLQMLAVFLLAVVITGFAACNAKAEEFINPWVTPQQKPDPVQKAHSICNSLSGFTVSVITARQQNEPRDPFDRFIQDASVSGGVKVTMQAKSIVDDIYSSRYADWTGQQYLDHSYQECMINFTSPTSGYNPNLRYIP